MNKRKMNICAVDIAILLALFLVGGFHEYISCFLSIIFSVYLTIRLWKSNVLVIRKDINALAILCVCGGYAVSCLWAVDSGMAFVGFLKFLPVGLFAIMLWQTLGKHNVLTVLPYFAAGMVVVSAVGMQLPLGEDVFSVAGRLAGFFQYPNTFAVFLLVCELLLLKKPQKAWWDYVIVLLLLSGLLYTGSRAVFVLCVVLNFVMLLVLFGKKGRAVLLALAAVVALVGVVLVLSGNTVVSRYLTISLTESTFIGRILYFVDALPLLLRHPFGMGYMGYYYSQGSVQTGVYTVAYIHNDFVQLLLDIGWLPGGIFIGAVVAYFLRKSVPVADKIVTLALCLHCLFDFNLQMIGMFFLLLVLLDKPDAPVLLVKTKFLHRFALPAMVVLTLYMGIALSLAHWGQYNVADTMYPFNTRNKLIMLEQETDLETANALADEILKQNTTYFAPYSIKAKYSYAKGDFTSLIQYKREVFKRNPFEQSEYEEYAQMLINGIALYSKGGDTRSIAFCCEELYNTQRLLAENRDRLSALGKMIDDQPIFELSEEVRQYIGKLEVAP